MPTRTEILDALEREVHKLVERHNDTLQRIASNRRCYKKRSGQPAKSPAQTEPAHWSADSQFNPYYVRARRESIAHAIVRNVRQHTYTPRPTLLLPIPKPSGGTRDISIATVPDAAVSYWLGSRLIKRNAYKFSSYTYAYRADRNAHHAIDHLMSVIRGNKRLFVLESNRSQGNLCRYVSSRAGISHSKPPSPWHSYDRVLLF